MYIDAKLSGNQINVVERINGQRVFTEYTPKYLFYYPDAKGNYTSIYGEKLAKFQTTSNNEFQKEKRRYKRLYESDCDVVFRCLADHYKDAEFPTPNIAFFDIEVDFSKKRGFSEPADPFNPIIAVAVHAVWLNQTVCLVLKPSGMEEAEAKRIINEFDNVLLMENEIELIETFLILIADADIVSGWNSEGYDIPYIVNRMIRLKDINWTRELCLWNEKPRKRKFIRFEKEQETYDLCGRIHLDYLQLYRKYTYHEMHSYSLDAISEYEIKERKVAYEGTLEQLYNQDFKKFIEYNIQDTDLLKKLDAKLQFIDLANAVAHTNLVLLPTTMGSVAQIDQAIINDAHDNGLIVPDKKRSDDTQIAAGAFVFKTKVGLHHWLASMDITSLYPSIIRALNMSPECIVGQIQPLKTIKKWDGKFSADEYELVMGKDKSTILTIDYENGITEELTGAELYKKIHDQNWMLSGNGTLFHHEREGIIPILLTRWFNERIELQKKRAEAKTDELREFYDKRQHIRKIQLNSVYGSLLNRYSRFYDFRMGQSVTLTGRCVNRHMASAINEVLTNEYNHYGKCTIYGDTDSCYFSAYKGGDWTEEKAVEIYDGVAEIVNDTFIDYMKRGHNCPGERGKIISAAREIIAKSGLFVKKKRYGLLIINEDGKSVNKVKATGFDQKRSDTPAYMQDFLKDLLQQVLEDCDEKKINGMIQEFRTDFRNKKPWEMGRPMRVNKLTYYTNQ